MVLAHRQNSFATAQWDFIRRLLRLRGTSLGTVEDNPLPDTQNAIRHTRTAQGPCRRAIYSVTTRYDYRLQVDGVRGYRIRLRSFAT
jgi:hypothetical protein